MPFTTISNNVLPTLDKSKLPTGTILQVQQASNTDAHTTTSTSFTTIETVNITPTFSNSIIKLTFTGRSYTAVLTVEHGSRFVRDSTELETYLGQWTASGATAQRETFEFYDTPNTTSQITYKFEHRVISAGNQMHFSPNAAGDGGVYLTATEIKV